MSSGKEVLQESLSSYVGDWFTSTYQHPFWDIQTIVVPDSVKPIPHLWVNDVELDEFGAEMGDIMGEGPVLSWSQEERKQRLYAAMKRLDLTEDQFINRNLKRLSRAELSNEKKRVKYELKRYDMEWKKQFKVLPNHAQKEIMRPLYVYYRRLKHYMMQAEDPKGSAGLPNAPDSDDENQPGMSPRGKLASNDVEARVQALEGRIASLQQDKGAVRARLREYQERFVVEHMRKIRFHRDILPIEREYRMYKTIKDDIAKVESQLRSLREAR